MDDAMEIDTHPQTHHTAPPADPVPAQNPEKALHTLLKSHLAPFITTQITRTLGSEYIPIYGAPENASARALVAVVESRWLAVFSDSPLHSSRELVTRLSEALSCHTPIPRLASLIEELFLVIGQPTAAAQAAHFRRKGPKRASSVQQATPATSRSATGSTSHGETSANSFVPPSHGETSANSFVPVVPDTPMASDQHKFVIVLDGSNIAWRHGQSSFSMRGLLIAREYYISRKHRTITFLPEGRVTSEYESLKQTPDVVLTPSKDYDDAYIVHYARTHMGVVVSNDEFRDVVYQASADGSQAEKEWKTWLKACRVSFTFHGDTFLPNPAFNWNRASTAAAELRLRD